MSFTASLTISWVLAVVWVLDNALLVILDVVVAGLTTIVGSDMAVGLGGSGCETGAMCFVGVLWVGLALSAIVWEVLGASSKQGKAWWGGDVTYAVDLGVLKVLNIGLGNIIIQVLVQY